MRRYAETAQPFHIGLELLRRADYVWFCKIRAVLSSDEVSKLENAYSVMAKTILATVAIWQLIFSFRSKASYAYFMNVRSKLSPSSSVS